MGDRGGNRGRGGHSSGSGGQKWKKYIYGPRPLNSTRRYGPFLKSTSDIRLSDMRQGTEIDSDMRHCHFLNSTCNMALGINERQRHSTLPFLKINRRHGDRRHGDTPVKGPIYTVMVLHTHKVPNETFYWVNIKVHLVSCLISNISPLSSP